MVSAAVTAEWRRRSGVESWVPVPGVRGPAPRRSAATTVRRRSRPRVQGWRPRAFAFAKAQRPRVTVSVAVAVPVARTHFVLFVLRRFATRRFVAVLLGRLRFFGLFVAFVFAARFLGFARGALFFALLFRFGPRYALYALSVALLWSLRLRGLWVRGFDIWLFARRCGGFVSLRLFVIRRHWS